MPHIGAAISYACLPDPLPYSQSVCQADDLPQALLAAILAQAVLQGHGSQHRSVVLLQLLAFATVSSR